jgi:hypothetical protein
MRQLLAERIREPRRSPHRHSHGQVLPFDKRSADLGRIIEVASLIAASAALDSSPVSVSAETGLFVASPI